MAQSTTTVTPPNPSPPTNIASTGATAPNPPNYTKNTYNELDNWGVGTNSFPPPYYDDGAAGALTTLATNVAALASGSGATAGGCEASMVGAGAGGTTQSVENIGAVPASTSVAHEGAGSEVVVTAPGSVAAAPTQSVSTHGSYVSISDASGVNNSPNSKHLSSLSPAVNPTVSGFAPATQASGGGTFALQVNGANFTRQSVVYMNGIAQATTFTSSIRLDCPTCLKKATSGTLPFMVVTGGAVQTTSPTTYTFT